jgi:hypothetical protein
MGRKFIKVVLLCLFPAIGYSQSGGFMPSDTSINYTVGANRIKFKSWPYTLNALALKAPLAGGSGYIQNLQSFTTPQTGNYSFNGIGYISDGTIDFSTYLASSGSTVSTKAKSIVAFTTNPTDAVNNHSFSDNSNFYTTINSVAHNSFDYRINITGTGNNDHTAGFQDAPTYNSTGTQTNMWGIYSRPTVNSGTITNRIGVYVQDIAGSGGTITNNTGIEIAPLTRGVTNYAIFNKSLAPIRSAGDIDLVNSSGVAGTGMNVRFIAGSATRVAMLTSDYQSSTAGNLIFKVRTSSGSTDASLTEVLKLNGGATPSVAITGKATVSGAPTAATDVVRKTELDLKQDALILTTTGTSGNATLIGNVLNVPNYAGGGGSGTVTSVSSANTDIGVSMASPTPVLTLNSGTGASQIVKRDASARVTDIVPSIVQGDLLIGAGAGVMARLAKNASSTRYLSNTGTSNDPAWAQVALSTGVSGILPGVNGGTGQNVYAVGDILYASSTTNLSKRAIGTTGYLLTVSGGLPVWSDPSTTLIQNQVASDQIAGFRVSSTSYANGGIESRDFYRLRKTGSLAFAIDLQLAAPSANRIQTLQNDDGTVALTKNSTGYAINTTTTALSSATLNSTYPDVDLGYRVICGDIILGGVIYTKYTEAGTSDIWLTISAPVTP